MSKYEPVVQPTPAMGWHLSPFVTTKRGTLRWVTCAKDDNETVSRTVHLLRSPLTTLCGCSASMPEVWSARRAQKKETCEGCAAVLDNYDRRNSRLRRALNR